MRKIALLFIVLLAQVAVAFPFQSSASEKEAPATRELPPPSWYTPDLHDKILAAGHRGVEVKLTRPQGQAAELNCLGYSPPSVSSGISPTAVSAGGCMVYPHGCTMNFIFRDATSYYIGTAGHCVSKGSAVVMQVGTRVDPTDTLIVLLAKIGKTAKRVNQGIGKDFGLVKIDPGWAVVPGVAGVLGPTGVFCGDPVGQPVAHYGHGYVFAVEQGVVKFGEVLPDLTLLFKMDKDTGYNWAGYGLPGDSGSGVMNAAGLAVGNLTHGIGVAGVPIPGLNMGTTMSGIFGIIGTGYSLVTADGRRVNCPTGPLGL